MACRFAGRLIGKAGIMALALVAVSCGRLTPQKPLDPRLTFTVGSSFLGEASSLALKGRIEFFDGRASQSGSYRMFLEGPDSLSFLIEGPFGADVFKMIIDGELAYLRSNGDAAWTVIGRGERAAIDEYGIENISPFLTGFFIFPQYYLADAEASEASAEFAYHFDGQEISGRSADSDREFLLIDPETGISALYSRRKDIDGGYFPSQVTIFDPDAIWELRLTITNIRLNPTIPAGAWRRD